MASPKDISTSVSSKFDCTDEEKSTEAYVEAKKQSENIFSGENLSTKDREQIAVLKTALASVIFMTY